MLKRLAFSKIGYKYIYINCPYHNQVREKEHLIL